MTLRVLHVTTGLELGGAEMVLARLLGGTRGESEATVYSLNGPGRLGPRIEALGAEVLGGSGSLSGAAGFRSVLRSHRPDVVQTWMYHADLIAGVIARASRVAPVVWGLHAGVLDPAGWRARSAVRSAAALSRVVPRRIICCSQTSYDVHGARGYDAARMVVVDNGFTIPAPPLDDSEVIRGELGLPPDAVVLTRPARYHPQKDFPTLLHAFDLLHRAEPAAHLVLVGHNVDAGNAELAALVRATPAAGNVHLLGERDDVDRIYAASDVVVSSSSFGEALPLVIGEAMAAGVPVVATDVGDSRRVVGDTGAIVPARDPQALADALLGMVRAGPAERERLGRAARARIETDFSLARMCAGYLDVYRQVVGT